MAIVVKGEITITKGFDTWKAMVKKKSQTYGRDGDGNAFCWSTER